MKGYHNKLALNYSKERSRYIYTDSELFEMIEKVGIKNKNILDFGCGDGIYCFKLSSRGAKKIIGIDLSKSMIDLANNRLRKYSHNNIEFLLADGNNLPFDDEIFDLVLANYVLVHFKDLQKPLNEIYRVLKPGGSLIATINNAEFTNKTLKDSPVPLKLGNTLNVVVNDYLKTDDETQIALKKSGFLIKKYKQLNNPDVAIDPNYSFSEEISNFHCVIFLTYKE